MTRHPNEKVDRALDAAAKVGLEPREFLLLALECIDQAGAPLNLQSRVTNVLQEWFGLLWRDES